MENGPVDNFFGAIGIFLRATDLAQVDVGRSSFKPRLQAYNLKP